jgi:hypothetical protein
VGPSILLPGILVGVFPLKAPRFEREPAGVDTPLVRGLDRVGPDVFDEPGRAGPQKRPGEGTFLPGQRVTLANQPHSLWGEEHR